MGHCLFVVLRALSDLSQVREKIGALLARRAELASAIAILSRSASALRVRRGGIAPTALGDSATGSTVADPSAVADASSAPGNNGGGGITLVAVTRSLAQMQRLRGQFDRRWGFVCDRTHGAALEVCVCVCVCVCMCVCVFVCACVVAYYCST